MSKICKLKDIAVLKTGPFGTQFKASEYVDEGIPVINVKNIGYGNLNYKDVDFITEKTRDRLSEHILQTGDIVFGRKGSVDRHCLITEKENGWFQGSDCLRVRIIDSSVNPQYVSYYLLSSHVLKSINNAAVGSTMASINMDIIGEIKIMLPSYEEQCKIAMILKSLDDKRALNAAINDNLQQQIRLLYDYWFTQFDFPDKNGNPYKSSGGTMGWNPIIHRDIPVCWKVTKLLDIVSWESNSQPPKSEFVYEPKDGYIRFIQNRDYDSDNHQTYIPYTKNLSTVDKFDILMDKYGDAGAVRYGIEGAFNVALGKINVNRPNFQEYIRSFLESDGVYSYLHNSCMASTRASLNESNLSMLNVVIPDEDTVSAFQLQIRKIRESILLTNDENLQLENLRNWLLPMLMNGQAVVQD